MFCSRKSNNLVNKVQEGVVSHQYNEKNFQVLLKENNEISKHQRNLLLMTEIYQVKNNQATPIMHHLFQFYKTLSIQENSENLLPMVRKVKLRIGNYKPLFLLAKLLFEYKNSTSLIKFKST